MTTLFYVFRDAPRRRRALLAEPGSAERYALYGLDQLAARGYATRHNLERSGRPAAWARVAGRVVKRVLEAGGGYGGDFATVFASLRTANRSDVVFSTVDTVGIPLVLSKRARLLRVPLVYVAIGLPERLERLRNERMRRLYAAALGSSSAVLAYSRHEADVLSTWLEDNGREVRVEFVPFGVDSVYFSPADEPPSVDVVSIGADPHRDYDLLLRVAAAMPEARFLIVTDGDRARTLRPLPSNVTVETEVPFAAVRSHLAAARTVALPVLDNSYSGATTVLLQAMSTAKPIVVTRTQAIASGYGLVDGENCRLVPPGDERAFVQALTDVLGDDLQARALARRARETVEDGLTWDLYVDRIEQLVLGAHTTHDPPSLH